MCESDTGKFLDSIPPTPLLLEKNKKKDLFFKKRVLENCKNNPCLIGLEVVGKLNP